MPIRRTRRLSMCPSWERRELLATDDTSFALLHWFIFHPVGNLSRVLRNQTLRLRPVGCRRRNGRNELRPLQPAPKLQRAVQRDHRGRKRAMPVRAPPRRPARFRAANPAAAAQITKSITHGEPAAAATSPAARPPSMRTLMKAGDGAVSWGRRRLATAR